VTVGFFPEELYIDDITEQELVQHTFIIYWLCYLFYDYCRPI